MASHSDSDEDVHNPHGSSTRWRHQESSRYSRFAGTRHGGPRDDDRGNTDELAKFFNSSRVEPKQAQGEKRLTGNFKPIMIKTSDASDGQPQAAGRGAQTKAPPDGTEIVCGPLLNYRRMEGNRWFGSVLIVTKGGGKTQSLSPNLILRRAEKDGGSDVAETNGTTGIINGEGINGSTSAQGPTDTHIQGMCLYSDPRNTFWAFDLEIDLVETETKWEYTIPAMRFASKTKPQRNYFFVPAITESFRIMFHSCNGFSVGTDEDAWSGPALWNDVLRRHTERPWHVMIGGGDQIYNDGIRVNGPLRPWTDISNPKKRRDYPFPEKLRQDCDDYYLKNYIRWYSTEPFASANGQIPQLNIWDDHDIIDGFGSYVNDFMKCDVFRGIGGTAHKYYLLFQHHLPPPPSTYTTDSAATMTHNEGVLAEDPQQLIDTYVAPGRTEPNYILGPKPGPYVAEHSHSIFARLGARIAFLGLDARTERTRHQVNYPETYEAIFSRLRNEMESARNSRYPFKHLIVLLGIPIAYPRLTWLENLFRSPLIGPVKFLNRRFGVGGSLFNQFDGSVDLLDDLDDHYTARTHKKERNDLVERLQSISADYSVRITILGGDVHLAALGRFYSKPTLKIPVAKDHRYIANVVSSAIVNKPPPHTIANLLAGRNKIHHLDDNTDETLLRLFDKSPGDSSAAPHNHVTMPHRNYAMLTENSPNNAGITPSAATNGDANTNSETDVNAQFYGKNGHSFLHKGELEAGTKHKAASPDHGKGNDGSLDICIQVEIDQHDREGKTEGYGMTVPSLDYKLTAPRREYVLPPLP